MFTQSDLSTLIKAAPGRGVSLFMPTHVSGPQTRQDPIRFRNLLTEAHTALLAAGASKTEARELLAPAEALIEDVPFWRHQDQGLALFLGADGTQYRHQVPLVLTEQVIVGADFYVKPLLPLLAADGEFAVLTMTAEGAHLYSASKFAMTEDYDGGLPGSPTENLDDDRQHRVQATPAARPHTGGRTSASTQAYGVTPADWRKTTLEEWAGKVTSAVDRHLADAAIPLVLVADAELAGQFKKRTTLGPLFTGTVDTNPAALTGAALHAAAYEVVRPRFEAAQRAAVEHAAQLLADGPTRVAVTIGEVVRAAFQGRVESLLVTHGVAEWGRFDEMTDAVETHSEPGTSVIDLAEYATVRTLEHKGAVYMLEPEQIESLFPASTAARAAIAVLRF
ncbi:baeRF3 domain-containing protein [Nocardia sp. NPDC003693]